MRRFRSHTEGATAIEYAFVAALIALGCIGALTLLGQNTDGLWTRVSNNVTTAR